jgi:hypothetical protein
MGHNTGSLPPTRRRINSVRKARQKRTAAWFFESDKTETGGVALMDSWKTYVFEPPMSTLLLYLQAVDLTADAGKSTLLYVIVLWVCPRLFIVQVSPAIIQDVEHMHAVGFATLAYYFLTSRKSNFRGVKK